MICHNLTVSPQGRLLFAGRDLEELKEEFGTPLYLYDEDRIREMCCLYRQALKTAFGEDSSLSQMMQA
jgi:diaminopimelate decarboxylase